MPPKALCPWCLWCPWCPSHRRRLPHHRDPSRASPVAEHRGRSWVPPEVFKFHGQIGAFLMDLWKKYGKMGENPHENHVLIPSSFTFPCDSTIKNYGKMMEKWKSSSQKKVVLLHKLVRKHFSPSNYGLICLNPTVHLLTQGISKLWFQIGTIFPQYQEIAQG